MLSRFTKDPINKLIGDYSGEEHLQRSLLVVTAFVMFWAGFIWGLMYFTLNEFISGMIPMSFSGICISILVIYQFKPNLYLQLFLILRWAMLLLPYFLFISLGSYGLGSGVVIWSLLAPFISMLLPNPKVSTYWYLVSIALIVTPIWFVPYTRLTNNISDDVQIFLTAFNIVGMSAATFILLRYSNTRRENLAEQLNVEKVKSENLLKNMLPESIIPLLRENKSYVEKFDNISILFADIVGFTKLSQQLAPEDVINILNSIFSFFDTKLGEYDAEKIRTVGDSYMVCIGAPRKQEHHADLIAGLALDMIEFMNKSDLKSKGVSLRIGINSGSAIAGVLGNEKYHFDIWSDDVNMASRMESHGISGKIQITEATYQLIKKNYICEKRGEIEVKGGRKINSYLLLNRK